MTKYLSIIVLVATVVVAACSGGGSGASAPAPPVTTASWGISSFTASDTDPFVGSVVAITASATKDGAAVPDGTTIEISVAYDGDESSPEFGLGSIGTTTHRLASSGGTVTTSLIANTKGPYNLTAKVSTATDALTVTYHHRNPSTTLQIYQPLLPNRGSLNGGEEVILNGKGIKAPVEVDFEVNGESYPSIVIGGQESDPPSADGFIKVRTPYISHLTDDERLLDWPSTVTVKVGLNTVDEQTETLPGAFTFLAGPSGPQSVLQEPFIYLVIPDYGQSAGGQQVTILGRNFRATVTDDQGTVTDTPVAVDTVAFGGIDSVVLSVSADGTQIVCQTPRWSNIPLDADHPVDVVVTTSFETNGPYTATLPGGFVYLADEPTPEITAISPTGGPIDGGEQVTIFGHGFQTMAQVTFGNLEAIGVQVNDDQSLADQDTIICVTPDYSQQGDEPPVAVDVIVRNILTGKVSGPANYTYGDNLYISGNTPSEGGAGDNIIIYGSGFEAPLQVDFGSIRLDVMSVSGTELLVRFPVDTPPSCSNVTGSFTVTLLESGSVIDGGSFTFLGSNPQIFGVDPIFVQEEAGGDSVSPNQVTINGDYFSPNVIVEIGNFRIANMDIEVVNTNTIDVNRIPAPNDFGITWDQSPCVTDLGLQGIRRTATPVDVSVINLPGNCSDTLAGGLVYEPELPVECVVAPAMTVIAPTFPGADAGTCSAWQNLTISNGGGGTLEITAFTLQGPFGIQNAVLPLLIDPYGINTDVQLQFCPTIHTGAAQEGQLVIVSNDPGSPTAISLSGLESAPFMVVAPQSLDFGTTPGDLPFEISNTGTVDLTWSIDPPTDPSGAFSYVANPPGPIAPGLSTTVTVSFFSPGGSSGDTFSLILEVTAAEPDVQGDLPAFVSLTATNP